MLWVLINQIILQPRVSNFNLSNSRCIDFSISDVSSWCRPVLHMRCQLISISAVIPRLSSFISSSSIISLGWGSLGRVWTLRAYAQLAAHFVESVEFLVVSSLFGELRCRYYTLHLVPIGDHLLAVCSVMLRHSRCLLMLLMLLLMVKIMSFLSGSNRLWHPRRECGRYEWQVVASLWIQSFGAMGEMVSRA